MNQKTDVKKNKILYLMHVDWHWIKQRPHFLAEGLSQNYEVDVRYVPAKKNIRKNLPNNKSTALKLKTLIKVPFSGRSMFVRRFQKYINGAACGLATCDIVWICAPEILYSINIDEAKSKIVIYDCMDDMIESNVIHRCRKELMAMEQEIIQRADIIFVSSDSLYNKMLARGANKKQLMTIYNATSLSSLRAKSGGAAREKDFFTITYFGTITHWIDVEMIHRLLNDYDLKNLRVKMIGPSEVALPIHERLIHVGPVSHEDLSSHVTDNDLFILPFILNSITISVDPVKFYEYIAFHGNIAARFYPEIERYSEFVNFYNDYEGLKEIILNLRHDNSLKYSHDVAEDFLAINSWDNRVTQIIERIKSISKVVAESHSI